MVSVPAKEPVFSTSTEACRPLAPESLPRTVSDRDTPETEKSVYDRPNPNGYRGSFGMSVYLEEKRGSAFGPTGLPVAK